MKTLLVAKQYIKNFISKYEDVATAGNHKEGMIRVSGVQWYTNLDHKKRHDNIILYKSYSPDEYPKYINFDAIEVARTELIPCDYNGLMGVPITFMDKYNPQQFEIIGFNLDCADMSIVKERLGKLNGGPAFYVEESNGDLRRIYTRIIVKRINV